MKPTILSLILFCSLANAQVPASLTPLSVDLRPTDDRFHLVGTGIPLQEDLSLLLKANGYAEAASGNIPGLTLLPSVCSVQGGYAYGVIAYLKRPGVENGLRSSSATVIRVRQSLTPGLRQAVADSTAALLQTLKEPSTGGPLKTLRLSEAPQRRDDQIFIPIQKLRLRIQPDSPHLTTFALARGVHGVVRVSVIVGSDGLPERADYLSGPPELAFPALAYAFQYAFVPSVAVQTFRTELAVPFGAYSRADLDLPGEGLVRTIPTPSEMIATPSGMMPEQ